MKLSRRSFIASIAAAGLLSAMPKPIRAWADDLYLPKGTELIGPDGVLIAVSNKDIWSFDLADPTALDWACHQPTSGSSIGAFFFWAEINARSRLGLKATESNIINAKMLIDDGYPSPFI